MTGQRGAGTVFFSGCALRYLCQNYQISQEGLGEEISPKALADIFLDLQQRGCHLDLVSPTPHWPFILQALEIAIPPGADPPRSSITPTGMFPLSCCNAWKGSWTSICRT